MEPQPLRLNQQRRSQGLPDIQRNPMEMLCPFRRQLAQALQCPMVKLCQLLQVMKLPHSHLGPMRLVQLLRVARRKAQPQMQLVLRRTPLFLLDRLRRPWSLNINSFPARDPIPSHQLVMILRLHKSSPRTSYTDHPRRRLRLKAIISDLPAFLPMSLKFCTKTVALVRNLPTQG